MRIIDTHTHIYDTAFDADREAVVQRARAAGVERVLLPNEDSSSYEALLATRASFPDFCEVMLGIHPTSVGATYRDEIRFMEEHLDAAPWRAIGEIGMDLYWDKTYVKEQKAVFEWQLALACERGLPVAIHVREAMGEAVDSLRRFDAGKLHGVIHAFSGVPDQARAYLRCGDFYFGIGGVATYKNAKFASQLPEIGLQRLLLETDAPYLTPVPHRGKRNEPSYLLYVAGYLAGIFGVSPDEIAEQTSVNAEKLFF